MEPNTRIKVTGPVSRTEKRRNQTFAFPASSHLGKTGTAQSVNGGVAVVLLDGEQRPRNFQLSDLAKE